MLGLGFRTPKVGKIMAFMAIIGFRAIILHTFGV